jgi:putative component of toxin-antitoxin plasmid stabilization module
MAQELPEWLIENAYASPGKFARFSKKHEVEYDSLFANLDKIIRLLRSGNKIGGFRVGFFRAESEGVYRIGQTAVANAKESRLYVFPDSEANVMYVLTVGDKDSQSEDINEAKQIVKRIKNQPSQ